MRRMAIIGLLLLPALGRGQGLVIPEDIETINAEILASQPKAKNTLEGLPEAWDCRALGYVSEVRDQGACGSCWAMATVSVVEAVMAHDLGIKTKLSPQWLIDRGRNSGGCSGGFPDFSPFLADGSGDACKVIGGVLEQDWPYKASTQGMSCPGPERYVTLNQRYIYGWGGPNAAPGIADIKYGLMTAGPLAVGITLSRDLAFCKDWTIIRGARRNIDHCVVLVGWGVEDGTEFFIIQNSYGAKWGVGGFARVEINSLGIGYSAYGVVTPIMLAAIPEPTPRPQGAAQPETAYSPVVTAETAYNAPQALPEPIIVHIEWLQLGLAVGCLSLALLLARR